MRLLRRIRCLFTGHKVEEFHSFSCQCQRCEKGWHPEVYFRGVFTFHRCATLAWNYLFKQ